jgi:hypothetical protein
MKQLFVLMVGLTFALLAAGQAPGPGTFTTLSANTFSMSGPISAPFFTGTGTPGGFGSAQQTQTDSTTPSGTLTNVYFDMIARPTFATAGNLISITNGITLYIPNCPGHDGNVTITYCYALDVGAGLSILGGGAILNGGVVAINANSRYNTMINTGSGAGEINIGNASNPGHTSLLGLSTGTSADFLCLSSEGTVLLQSSACTMSSLRYKQDISDWDGSALQKLGMFEVATFRMKSAPNRDPNYRTQQIGLIAENIAKIEPKCAIYENDMKTPKSYRQECVIAMLVKALQEQQAEIDELRTQIPRTVVAAQP